jgi:5-hydroxyisourate hydrolase-like protein (transthyretin family)
MSNMNSPLTFLPTLRRAVLALVFVCLFFPSLTASAQSTATLSGRVTNSKGEPVSNVGVVLYTDRDIFSNQYYAVTNANGEYALTDVLPDTYLLGFRPESISYRDEFYNDQSSLESADNIVVSAGATLTGYDAVLPNSGRIVGTVTNPDENPIANVQVESYYFNGLTYDLQDSTETDSSGIFTIETRYDKPHFLRFVGSDEYLGEYYNDKREIDEADPLSATAEETITVAVTLRHSQTISGTVVDGHGLPVANVGVQLENHYLGDWWWPESTTTDANGRYRFEHFPRYREAPNYQYRLWFYGSTIVDEYYIDQETSVEADIIDLTYGPDLFIANAQVTRHGIVTGTVTDINGAPIEDVAVRFKTFSQEAWRTSTTVYTNEYGNYQLAHGSPDREYRVEFDTDDVYVTEFYPNSYSVETAQTITIPLESTIPNINAQLTPGASAVKHVLLLPQLARAE